MAETFTFNETNRYLKDLKVFKKQSRNWAKDLAKLKAVLDFLEKGQVPTFTRCHKMDGSWLRYPNLWDIHVGSANSDWILLVSIDKKAKVVTFVATGTHSYLDKVMHESVEA